MAEPDLIDQYLVELRRSLDRRSDVVDLADEIEDHLREAAGRLCSAGANPLDAQRHTLDRFGETAVVARAFALNSTGGLVMPTAFTRSAGVAALVTAALWCLAAATKWWESELFAPWTQQRFVVFSAVLVAAVLGTVLVVLGMVVRIGRRDLVALVAVFGGLGTVAFAATAWMWPIWALAFSVAFLLVLRRWHDAVGGGRPADWALVAAWPLALGVVVALSVLEVGPVDEYGEYPASTVAGFAVGAVLMAIGLVSSGTRMLSEKSAREVQRISV